MERKIGEIFNYDGEWYQCVEGRCKDCYFSEKRFLCKQFITKDFCTHGIIFKKLEKVGGPYNVGKKVFQRYEVFVKPYIFNDEFFTINTSVEDSYISTEIKQNKEDMEEKELTYEELLHYYHSTVGLWAIDRNPQEVHFDWICKNAFQLGMDKILSNFEKIGKNLKPFDLQAAKSGKPVCTRDGRKAIFLTTLSNKNFPVVAIVSCGQEENIYQYDINGVCDEHDNNLDLMMLPEKKEGWVNVYRDADTGLPYCGKFVYSNEADAVTHNDPDDTSDKKVSVTKITWEE